MEVGKEKCKVLAYNPSGCGLSVLPGKLLNGGMHNDPNPLVVLEDGSHGLCTEVLGTAGEEDSFYLLVIKMPARIQLGERVTGMLDGSRCAFAACIKLRFAYEKRVPPNTVSHLVCCAACCRLQTGHQAWTHWDHLSDRQAFFEACVSYDLRSLRHQVIWTGSDERRSIGRE
jgi:hypothetical protein